MPNPLIAHFRMLARYNCGANERLYDSCARLDDAERKTQRRAFFGSIHGTLNHIMVGDRIWLARFSGETVPSTGLDAILFDDFEELRAARVCEDARIEAFAAGLDDDVLLRTIHYRNHEGLEFADPSIALIAHLFNHQTHHRGQVHDMLMQTDVPPPSLDMHRILNPEPLSLGGG